MHSVYDSCRRKHNSQFPKFMRAWRKLSVKELRQIVCPKQTDLKSGAPGTEGKLEMDIGAMLLFASQRCKEKYGLLPKMALLYLSACSSQSFCERVNSAGKLIVPPKRTNLSDDILEARVILRMNRKFILHFEGKHTHGWEAQLSTPKGFDEVLRNLAAFATGTQERDLAGIMQQML